MECSSPKETEGKKCITEVIFNETELDLELEDPAVLYKNYTEHKKRYAAARRLNQTGIQEEARNESFVAYKAGYEKLEGYWAFAPGTTTNAKATK
jgi:hypothetical protein